MAERWMLVQRFIRFSPMYLFTAPRVYLWSPLLLRRSQLSCHCSEIQSGFRGPVCRGSNETRLGADSFFISPARCS